MQGMKNAVISAIAVAALAGTASAGISDTIFMISMDLGGGNVATYEATLGDGTWLGNGEFEWSIENVSVMDGANEAFFIESASLIVNEDPVVQANFSLQAGPSSGVFTVSSALVSFSTFGGVTGSASAAVTITDFNGDGATLAPNGPSMYTSYYNGIPGVGTTFAGLLSGDVVAPQFGSNNAFEDHNGGGFWPIAGSISNISSQWTFGLTAFDIAGGTSTFEVVPAPASLALLGLGGFSALRRRR